MIEQSDRSYKEQMLVWQNNILYQIKYLQNQSSLQIEAKYHPYITSENLGSWFQKISIFVYIHACFIWFGTFIEELEQLFGHSTMAERPKIIQPKKF